VYDSKRRQMERDSATNEPVNEKFLFHGTSRNAVDAICANNFDWRVCGSHGTVYGQGTFAVARLTVLSTWQQSFWVYFYSNNRFCQVRRKK